MPLAKIEKNGDRRFSLRGFTQPMGVAEYEIKQLIEEVQNSLPNIEDIELGEDRQEYGKKWKNFFCPSKKFSLTLHCLA